MAKKTTNGTTPAIPGKIPAKPKPPAPAKPAPDPTTVDAVKHTKATRTNIPTREMGDMVAADEARPVVVRYPRDESLDPQLVWKGKDEQDGRPLEIPAPPIYIQEKIHPQALIEDIRAAGSRAAETSLFSDFNGLASKGLDLEYYRHDRHWTNRLILGDSLQTMASLAEKEKLRGQVQMVYFDPPYGIKFGSNWQVSTRKRDVKDAKAEDVTRQPEQIKAFRDTYHLGIHSYLAYIRERLVAARDLLTESGSIFFQIGDENVHLVRCLMDEVFGSDNCVSFICFRTTANIVGRYLGSTTNYLLWYAKQLDTLKYRQLYGTRTFADDIGGRYSRVEMNCGSRRVLNKQEREDISCLPFGAKIYRHDNLSSQGPTATGTIPFEFEGTKYHPGANHHWKTTIDGLERLAIARRLAAPTPNSLTYVRYLDDFPVAERTNVWTDTQTGAFTEDKVYVVQTNTKVIERCLLMTTDPGDLVLDPTCGSGTTAYVAEQWGRRWITTDTSRVALTLARTRLMAARFPFYLLSDSPEGRKKEAELSGMPPPVEASERDIQKGFVYRKVPHVTLKSIANNPDIKPGLTREQIDAAIRKHAETETLFDQPYEDNKKLRVAGPFTVESLSPHRMLPAGHGAGEAGEGQAAASSPAEGVAPADYVPMILANLRKAGVQNTKKGEKLAFDRLDHYAGEYLQADGAYTDAAGKTHRVAVCLGPEFGTVGPDLVLDAAKEAVRSVKADFGLVLVCGFAFDPLVWEEGRDVERQVGKMRVLLVRMNPDLSMGDELLKKTGAGNLFMVFGEPDIELRTQADGNVVVEVKGVDVFDPNSGEIRSSGPEDIACWFIDTDYDGKGFFVRQAYFLGGQDPYEKLKRALRAEVDEAEWEKRYSAVSIPFAPPTRGKIAVKVINHYGDEVLKVYPVAPPAAGAKR